MKDLCAKYKSVHVAKRSVVRTRVKVSSKVSVIPIASLLSHIPISIPQIIAPISSAPSSSEISVALTIDGSDISTPPKDDGSLHMTPGNLDLVTSLEPSPIIIKSLSAVDAESKAERAMQELVVPETVCVKQESLLDQMHAPSSVERFPLFSIIPTVQMFKDLFHTCTLHKFELGRDPPVVLNFADSKSGFGLVHKFQDLFHTCTLDQFELGRDPPNVLDIGDSRFGFG